jgi:hypothetical protein
MRELIMLGLFLLCLTPALISGLLWFLLPDPITAVLFFTLLCITGEAWYTPRNDWTRFLGFFTFLAGLCGLVSVIVG